MKLSRENQDGNEYKTRARIMMRYL